MKAVVLLAVLVVAAYADWTGYYMYAPNEVQGSGEQWQIQVENMLYGQYDNAGRYYGEISADGTEVVGHWTEAGAFQGGFKWVSADNGDSWAGTYWYGEEDNAETNLGSWNALRESVEVTSDDAMTDEPGAPLTGTWVSSDGFYEYYTVDQAFFEGVYVSIEGVHVAHMWGYSFDGANYVAWYEEYSTEDDTYFSWGNAAGYMHDNGELEEFFWTQAGAENQHYWTATDNSTNFAIAAHSKHTYEDALEYVAELEAAYYQADVVCEECPVCEDCDECEECPVCDEEGDDIETQINFDFAGLIPEN